MSRPLVLACFLAAAVGGVTLLWVMQSRQAPEPPGPQPDDTPPPAPWRFNAEERVPWTTSRVVGSPSPPPPYRLKRAFPKLKFDHPVHLAPEPGTNRLWVTLLPGKIVAVENDNETDAITEVGDLPCEEYHYEPYSMVFHPDYANNGVLFVFAEVKKRKPKDAALGAGRPKFVGTPARDRDCESFCRVSRFETTKTSPRRIVRESETPVIQWSCKGHAGSGMAFGPDGFLYITTGDGTSGSDVWNTGQDVTDLQASVLRIDVDHPSEGRAYGIPRDNPFLDVPGARPEVYAFGLRAPWRMTYDPPTGQFWIGEVGQDLWEQIHLLRRGANYGWSVREGNHPFIPERKVGPAPITGPVVEHHHTVGRSITGGYVYRGSKLPDLRGHYVYCDYETGKVWTFRYADGAARDHRELARSTYKIATFGIDRANELYLIAHTGEVFALEAQPQRGPAAAFPTRLSETGLFESTRHLRPAEGLIPYSVNAEVWADGARMERYLAVPGEGTIKPKEKRGWELADGSVLVQTLSLEARRVETRLLTRQDGEWAGYSYVWDNDQADAVLAGERGQTVRFTTADGRKRTWRVPSRSECMSCHSRAANWVLGLTTVQMDRDHCYGETTANQLKTLEHLGVLEKPKEPAKSPPPPPLVDPYDAGQNLDARARSYLHANCSHCHTADGGGNARIELEAYTPDDKTNLFDVDPLHGTFRLPGGKLIAQGDPSRSVLLYRVSKLGSGRMPHLASSFVDERGTMLLHDWIAAREPADEKGSYADLLKTNRESLRSLGEASSSDASDRIDRLFSTPAGALLLLDAVTRRSLPEPARAAAIDKGIKHADEHVRDLFERFLPEEQRLERLGPSFDPRVVLDLTGDRGRGETLYFEASGMQCKSCHAINGRGTDLGPDLSAIGKKYTREQLLESILDPSRSIEDKFAAWLVETKQGQVHAALLIEKTDEKVVLKNSQAQRIEIAAKDVEEMRRQAKSMMPDLLLRDATAQQAADLLEYLSSLVGAR